MNTDKIFVYPISLGCSKNQVDLENFLGYISKYNWETTFNYDKADIVLINTCAFIGDSKKESENIIKTVSSKKNVIVSGCYPQRIGQNVFERFNKVSFFVGTEFSQFSNEIDSNVRTKTPFILLNKNTKKYHECFKRQTLDIFHTYVKLSEGCSRKCSYCAIPQIRGDYRSRMLKNILGEISVLNDAGFYEFNLISEDTSLYGIDIYKKRSLVKLINSLNVEFQKNAFRLLYLFPDKYTYEVIDSVSDAESFLKYLDVPFQHVSKRIVERMGRVYEDPYKLCEYAKTRGIQLRTTLMVGYPGESERDFAILEEFLKSGLAQKIGIFIYSDEIGTKAFKMSDKVPYSVAVSRYNRLIKIYRRVTLNKMKEKIGKTFDAVFYEKIKNVAQGRLLIDCFDIDDKIETCDSGIILGRLCRVKIKSVRRYKYIV